MRWQVGAAKYHDPANLIWFSTMMVYSIGYLRSETREVVKGSSKKQLDPRQYVPLGRRCGAAVSAPTAPRRPPAGLWAAPTRMDCALVRTAPLRLTRPLCTGRQINLGSTVDERILSYAAARSQGGLQGGSSIPLGSSFRGHQHIPLGSSFTGALPCACEHALACASNVDVSAHTVCTWQVADGPCTNAIDNPPATFC
jgi:hypothetical protein